MKKAFFQKFEKGAENGRKREKKTHNNLFQFGEKKNNLRNWNEVSNITWVANLKRSLADLSKILEYLIT